MRAFRSLQSKRRRKAILQKVPSIKGNVEAIGKNRLEVVRMVIAEGLYTDVRLGHMNSEAPEAGAEDRWGKPNTTTRWTRINATVIDVRIRETIMIREGRSTLMSRLNSQLLGSLDLQSSLFKEIRGI